MVVCLEGWPRVATGLSWFETREVRAPHHEGKLGVQSATAQLTPSRACRASTARMATIGIRFLRDKCEAFSRVHPLNRDKGRSRYDSI